MKLSKECIEAIKDKMSVILWAAEQKSFVDGATEALTNPSIYEKAGLIRKEEFDCLVKELKQVRTYFGQNDKTPAQHKMYSIVDKIIKTINQK